MEKLIKLSDLNKVISELKNNNIVDIDILIKNIASIPIISCQEDLDKVFPFKIGDTIWEIDYFWDEPCIRSREISTASKLFLIDRNLGRTYFLTKEEAEKKLKELTGSKSA